MDKKQNMVGIPEKLEIKNDKTRSLFEIDKILTIMKYLKTQF